MKFIETFEELKALPNNTHVYKFVKGHAHGFYVVGTVGSSPGLVVCSDASAKDIYYIYERDFKNTAFTLDYNTREAGLFMIEQIKADAAKEIKDITEVYLKEK